MPQRGDERPLPRERSQRHLPRIASATRPAPHVHFYTGGTEELLFPTHNFGKAINRRPRECALTRPELVLSEAEGATLSQRKRATRREPFSLWEKVARSA